MLCSAIWGVVFCLDFGPFFFFFSSSLAGCFSLFIYLFIYLFNLFSNSPSLGNVGKA
jgi:hypothetical protein